MAADRFIIPPTSSPAVRRLLALALVALAAPAVAAEPYVVLADWTHGQALVGTTPLASSPLAAVIPFDASACHRALLLDLLYAPAETGADVDGVGDFALLHDFVAEVWRGDARLAQERVREPGYGRPLGETLEPGPHELRLWLATGAAVEYDARLRGRAVAGEPACLPPVQLAEMEANPAGPDAGAEWVEVLNPGDETLDLGLWRLETTHGTTRTWTFPANATLGPGERLVVTFVEGQTLDNEDESLALVDAFGQERDRTPAFTDASDDARTWQRGPDGWTFLPGTPGQPKP